MGKQASTEHLLGHKGKYRADFERPEQERQPRLLASERTGWRYYLRGRTECFVLLFRVDCRLYGSYLPAENGGFELSF